MPHLLPPALSPWVQAGWGGSLSPTRNPGSEPRGQVAGAASSTPGARQGRRLGSVGARGVLPALPAGSVPGIMDPHQGPYSCLLGWPGLPPLPAAPPARSLMFKAWGCAGGRGVVLVSASLAVPVSGAQSGLPDPGKPGGFGHGCPQAGLPQGFWDSAHLISSATAPLPANLLPSSILASALPCRRVAQTFAPLCAI